MCGLHNLSMEGRATVSARLGLLRNAPMTGPYAMPFAVDSWTSAAGQKRRFGDVRATSALPPKTDIHREAQHVSKVPILLQKSKIEQPKKSRES
jgi:hypothetical protein